MKKDEIMTLYPSIKKIKKFTKWKPNISFNEGLALTIKHYKKIIFKKYNYLKILFREMKRFL